VYVDSIGLHSFSVFFSVCITVAVGKASYLNNY